MRKEKIKVIIQGFGAMGSGMAKMITAKQGFQILGICDTNPSLIHHPLSDFIPGAESCLIYPAIEAIPNWQQADICLLATDSFTSKAFPKIEWLIRHHINVISTAEEMSYPQAKEPKLSQEMDRLAKDYGVTVLGTGVNPGMMMDLLVLFLTGVMTDVKAIEVSRINSLSPFGKTVMEEQGVGLSVAAYQEKKDHLAGHVGFLESMQMMADGLGLKGLQFHQEMQPIITSVDRKAPHGFAKAGDVCGIDMRASGTIDDQIFFKMNHPQQIEPHLEGIKTGDYIKIAGSPAINMEITPEVEGGLGTIAICVNMIPHVLNASPGLKTMLDLPVPRAILGDVRMMVESPND